MTNRHQVVVIQKDGQHPFPEPASVRRMALELFVTEAAIKQHLQTCTTSSLSPQREIAGSGWPMRPFGAVLSPSLCCETAVLTKSENTRK